MIDAPTLEQLPAKRRAAGRDGPTLTEITVHMKVVTPILGGGTCTRALDNVDIIRVPTIRGHLRFWWRALYGHQYATTLKLADAEGKLWGHAAGEEGGRSQVELSVTKCEGGEVDPSNPEPKKHSMPETPGFYALWPARSQEGKNGKSDKPTAPRWKPDLTFTLTVRCPENVRDAVENSIRAWMLFGGYGSRTRRGLGSVTVTHDPDRWLPKAATGEALTALFKRDILAVAAGRPLGDMPLLCGGAMTVGREGGAETSWTTALAWLSDFRQAQPQGGPPGAYDPKHARERASAPPGNRAGRSNWPESDKIRNLSEPGPWAHASRHPGPPVWPRAGFGLPIIGQFQKKDRQGNPYRPQDPKDYEIRWRGAQGGDTIDRLASPLIVKALPLANGKFVPCTLWLFRGYPAQGRVCLVRNGQPVPRSDAPFDLLVAPGDTARYEPLNVPATVPAGMRLRTAFMQWLRARLGLPAGAP